MSSSSSTKASSQTTGKGEKSKLAADWWGTFDQFYTVINKKKKKKGCHINEAGHLKTVREMGPGETLGTTGHAPLT